MASPFSDPDAVARYAEGPVRNVPGYLDMQRMAALLLAERCGADANILVLGAGGGLELRTFAEFRQGWRFVGVDPSAEMLALASQTIGPLAERVSLVEGTIDAAPTIPFDGATCLLTLHFLTKEERAHILRQIKSRLKPGAPLIVAHHSFPQDHASKAIWLSRYAAFAESSGVPAENTKNAAVAIGDGLPILSPTEDRQMLVDAGFADIDLFYMGFTFRGWVAMNPG